MAVGCRVCIGLLLGEAHGVQDNGLRLQPPATELHWEHHIILR